ncbi:MAG: hypothetical protein K2J67_11020 [Lachnospiraceae bacterium]|nr:hypothetical protein [Lachnospiraceae bacterium]
MRLYSVLLSGTFYIARKLGMAKHMLEHAIMAAYGSNGIRDYSFLFDCPEVRKMRHDMERKYVEGKLEL